MVKSYNYAKMSSESWPNWHNGGYQNSSHRGIKHTNKPNSSRHVYINYMAVRKAVRRDGLLERENLWAQLHFTLITKRSDQLIDWYQDLKLGMVWALKSDFHRDMPWSSLWVRCSSLRWRWFQDGLWRWSGIFSGSLNTQKFYRLPYIFRSCVSS